MDANSGGVTPRDVAEMMGSMEGPITIGNLTGPSGHRHFFLRMREIEWEDSEGKVHTEYHYKCVCGERVIP